MDKEAASKICDALRNAAGLCNQTLRTVTKNDTLAVANEYKPLVGGYMGDVYVYVLRQLWKAFPELEPAEMKQPDKPESSLSSESQQVIEAFLTQARQAMQTIETTVPADDRDWMELKEIHGRITAIERFLQEKTIETGS